MVSSSYLPWFIRLAYFTYFFGIGCVLSFYSDILNAAGLNNVQIGNVQSFGMFGGAMGPLVVGIVSDKTQRARLLVILCISFSVVMYSGPILIINLTNLGNSTNSLDQKVSSKGADTKLVVLLALIQFIACFCDQGAKSQLDGLVHKLIDKLKSVGISVDYARLRMFCPLGMGVSAFISGILLDKIKKVISFAFKEELLLAFFCLIFGVISVLVLIFAIPNAESKRSPNIFAGIFKMFKNYHVLVILFVFLLYQFSFGMTKSLENLYNRSLGGSKSLRGISQSVNRVGEILMMYFSPVINEAVGNRSIIISICLFITSLNFFFYSFADTPWLSLNYGFLNGFSVGLLWPNINLSLKELAPPALISSYISFLITFGKLGNSSGNSVGGIVSHKLGYRVLYICSAGAYAFAGLFYTVYSILSERRRKAAKHIVSEGTPLKNLEH